MISERWQNEVAETVFDTINFEADKVELKKKAKQKMKFDLDEKESDCILQGYIKKLGGPWTSSWQMRYAKLYPNRIELHPESAKPEMVFMDQIEEVSPELVLVKNENCIVIRMREGKIVLTYPVSSFCHLIGSCFSFASSQILIHCLLFLTSILHPNMSMLVMSFCVT